MLDLWLIGLVVCFVGGLRLVVYGFLCDCMILRVLCILLLLWLGWEFVWLDLVGGGWLVGVVFWVCGLLVWELRCLVGIVPFWVVRWLCGFVWCFVVVFDGGL